MTRQILIDNIVRQTTILIAQFATSGGVCSPLAQVADRAFLDLARELDEQGIGRRVSADMFGMHGRATARRARCAKGRIAGHSARLRRGILPGLAAGHDRVRTAALAPRRRCAVAVTRANTRG
jgi:hypothetical protein